MGSMRSGYFFDVKVSGNRVRLSYNMKSTLSNRTGCVVLADSMERATGWRFDVDSGNYFTSENFNLEALRSYRTRDGDWYIDNANTRNSLVLALRALAQALAAMGYIDPISVDTGQVLRKITRKNEINPLLNIGGKTYRMQLVEEKVSPFRVGEEFQQQVQCMLDAMEAGYAERLEEADAEYKAEVARIQSQRTMVFNLSRADHMAGYSTYQNDGRGWLVYTFRWKPVNFVHRFKSYKIKDEIAERMACDAEIHLSQSGAIRIWRPGTVIGIDHPHVYGHGDMCTGSYSSRMPSDLEDAKTIISEVMDLMQMINADSLVKGIIGEFDFHAGAKFIEEHCEQPDNKISEGAVI